MAGDAASGEPVTVTISDTSGPRAGVLVYFQNADSSLVASMTTDATGTASAVMPAGGFVTAVGASAAPGTAVFDDLETFASVQPGDHLVLPTAGFDYNIAAGDAPGFVSVQLARVSGGYDA